MTAEGNLDRERIQQIKQREDAAFVPAGPARPSCGRGRRRRCRTASRCRGSGRPTTTRRCSSPRARARGSATSTATSTRTSTSRTCRCSAATRRSRSSRPCRDAWRAGTQFLLPNEDALWVAEELGRRYGLPKWQFTLSATQANTEAIRVARALTGRDKVLFFDGKYHGHFDEALVDLQDGAARPRGGRPAARRHLQDEDRAVQRPRGASRRPGAARRRDRDHRAGDDEQRRPAAAGARVPRRAPGDHARDRHPARLRRDAHAGRRARRADADVVLEPDVVTIGKSIAGGDPARRVRHDRGGRRRLQRPDGRFDERTPSRPAARCSATRSRWPPRGPRWARSSPTTRTRTRTRWARGSPTASRRRSATPACRGPRTGSGPARA